MIIITVFIIDVIVLKYNVALRMIFSEPPRQGNRPPYFHPQPGMVNGDGHLYQGQSMQHQVGGPSGPGQYQQRTYPQMKVWKYVITFI